MIESKYWKQDLISFSKYLEKNKHFERWSEKAQVNFEKQIVIHFFLIRKLIESNKVSQTLTEKLYPLKKYKKSELKLTMLNFVNLEEQYNVDNENSDAKKVNFISNQLIHSLTLFGIRNGKKWDSVIMTSDYEKNKWLYRIDVKTISNIMREIGTNYPTKFKAIYDENKEDYKLTIE